MNRVPGAITILALACAAQLHAQTPPILTQIASNQAARGTAKLPGLAITPGQGPTLTFHGSNFSDNMAARFPTLDLQGAKSTIDLTFEQTFAGGELDSGKITLDYTDSDHLIISSGAVYLVDKTTGILSADSVDIVIVPSVFSVLTAPSDLVWGGGHAITLTPGQTLFIEGSGLSQDSTVLIFPKAGGDTLHVAPVAVGSAVSAQGGDEIVFRSDTVETGLMAQFIVPAGIAEGGGIRVETASGISAPYFYKKPELLAISRIGPPLRGTPADTAAFAVNASDTLELTLANLAGNAFPARGAFLRLPGISGPVAPEFITPDSSKARTPVPAKMSSGNLRVANEYSHALDLFTYQFVSDSSVHIQVVPTLDSLSGQITAPGFFITLFGGGLRTRSGAVVKFSKAGGGTTEVRTFSNNGTQLSVRIPDDAAPGPVFVETEGGHSDSLQLDFGLIPLEIRARAESGIPADTSEASAISGQTFTIKSTGITSSMKLRLLSGFRPTFSLRNISPDSSTAEVTLSASVYAETGLARLEDTQNNIISEAVLLQIVPTLDWVASPGFAPGSQATLYGSSYPRHATTATFTDSSGNAVNAEVIDNKNRRELVVILPPTVAAGLVRVTTAGGSDTLRLAPPVLAKLDVHAAKGSPADTSLPSANIGQVMRIEGENLSTDTKLRFPVVNESGGERWIELDLLNVTNNNRAELTVGSATIFQGLQIATGEVRLLATKRGFQPLISGQKIRLQIVPTLASFDVAAFAPGEIAALRGSGFIEGRTQVFFSDASGNRLAGANVDVVGSFNNELRVAIPDGAVPQTVTVQTDGGTTPPLTLLPPEIAAISPTEAIRGMTLQVTITGANFSIGSQVGFSSNGMAIDTTAFFSNTRLIAVLRIDPTAPLGARNVIVTNPSGDADTLFAAFTVLPDAEFPGISETTQLPATGDTTGPYRVQTLVTDNIGVRDVFLIYSTNGFATLDSLGMSATNEGHYSADLPGQPLNTTVSYFIAARDFEGNRSVDPPAAPAANYSFRVAAIPVFEPIADQTVNEGEQLTFSVHATDANGDAITYSAADLPRGANFADSTFSWTPDYTQSGNYTVTFTADDHNDGASHVQVHIAVAEINDPPRVIGPSRRTLFAGQVVDLPVLFTDPDHDALQSEFVDLPTGATIVPRNESLFVFRWETTRQDIGTHAPQFIAKDPFVADTLTVVITVQEPPGPIVESLQPAFGRAGDVVTLTGVDFGDGAGSMLFSGTPAAAMISGDTLARALVPPNAESGELLLVSPEGKVSNSKFFTVLPPRTVNLVAQFLEAATPIALAGQAVPLTIRIKNNGAFAASAKIDFFDQHPDSGGVALGPPLFFEIKALSRLDTTFDWIPETPGFYTPFARISGADQRDTKIFDNTVANGAVTVFPASLVEHIAIHAPARAFVIGKPQTYTITLLNTGPQPVRIQTISVEGGFGFVPITALPLIISPGESRSFDFTVTLPAGTAPGTIATALQAATASGNTFTATLLFTARVENPIITVRLLDDVTNIPVADTHVFADGFEQPVTDANGEVAFQVREGEAVEAVFFKQGYLPARASFTATGADRTVEVFIQPGEILITNIDVQPLSTEDIAQLGLDLNDPANFNLARFAATIRFTPDGDPVNVQFVAPQQGSEPTTRCGDRLIKGKVVARYDTLITLIVDEDETRCERRFLHIFRLVLDTGDTCEVHKPLIPDFYRFKKEAECTYIRKLIKEETLEFRDITCIRRTFQTCWEPAPESGESQRVSTETGGVVLPLTGVTIPYLLKINGGVRTLKDFFDVSLAVANQADPAFTVEDLQAELIVKPDANTDDAAEPPLTIMKEGEPLPDLPGGRSASTTWVLRGDSAGTHEISVTLTGTLMPGALPVTAEQFAFVTVHEPPELHLELQHPETVEQGQSFTLSALVTNLSDSAAAPQASIEVLLADSSTALLVSPARQELGDIPPGESKAATWDLISRGSGSISGCDQSSGNSLGFTLLIGGQPCDDALPSNTEKDAGVPPGKVVILGTDVPIPNVQVSASGIDNNGQPVRVVAVTDAEGRYLFPKRIHGDNLPFNLFINDPFGQNKVRPKELDFVENVAPNATAMPALEVGANNVYAAMQYVAPSLRKTASLNPFRALMAQKYLDEVKTLEQFLASSEANGLWGRDLPQTREEYYRLFLALRLMAEARSPAERMAVIGSETTSAAMISLVGILLDVLKTEQHLDALLTKSAARAYGGTKKAHDFVKTVLPDNLKMLYQRAIHVFEVIFSRYVASFSLNRDPAPGAIQLEKGLATISSVAAHLVKDLLTPHISWALAHKKLKQGLAELLVLEYAAQTDTLISEMLQNAKEYAGADSARSLVFSNTRMQDLKRSIFAGAKVVEENSYAEAGIDEFFNEFNERANYFMTRTALASATPLAPVSVPITAALLELDAMAEWLQRAVTIGFAFAPPLQLFHEIPAKLQQGVYASFDLPAPAANAIAEISSRAGHAGRAGQYVPAQTIQQLEGDFKNFRASLQAVRSFVLSDSIRAARTAYAQQVLPASKQLNHALNESGTLIQGANLISLSLNPPTSDSPYAAYFDSFVPFNANWLVLPWSFAAYAIVGELEGGLANEQYAGLKQRLLDLLDTLYQTAPAFEHATLRAIETYANRGLLPAVAVVDSIALAIDGETSAAIDRVPAAIIVTAHVRNLSDENLSGLRITLQTGGVDGLLFHGGIDSTQTLPELAPANGAPGGADEIDVQWDLTYQGSLLVRKSLMLTVHLESDSANVYATAAEPAFLLLRGVDSDEDGMPDEFERAAALDPDRDDSAEDPDRDQLQNLQEYLIGTDPRIADTDADGIADGVEVAQGSDALTATSPVRAGTAALSLPLEIAAAPGDTLALPVSLSTGSPAISAQIVVEYDSTLLQFEKAVLDSGLLYFTLDTVNTNPGFSPAAPGANKNVLVKFASAQSSISGNGRIVALLTFVAVAATDTTTRLSFDRTAAHTVLKDQDNAGVAVVSFTDATIRLNRATSVEETPPLPLDFALQQNYPNPFNPVTTIRYQLPKASGVKLVIYNILGQKVRTLVDGKRPPGFYAVEWDSRNDAGLPVASGVYLYRIKAGWFVRVRKMVVLR